MPWETDDSTGFKTDYDLAVTSAFFAPDAQYGGDGATLLQLHGYDLADGSEVREIFPCGKGWESLDGGVTVQHPEGKLLFHGSSWTGLLIKRMIELGVAQSVLAQRSEDTRVANVWEGLCFHIEREKVQFGKEIGEKEHNMPTSFLGVLDQAGNVVPVQGVAVAAPTPRPAPPAVPATRPPLPAPRPMPAPVAPPPSPPTGATITDINAQRAALLAQAQSQGQSTNGTEATLINLAKTLPDFATFAAQALDINEVVSDPVLSGQVVNGGPDGFFARHH